ncbi:structural protein [Yersinia phage vB_Yru_GN1]|uniref:Structural protein n=1 Tax=Yersinia phage vB_Yru_GN1 TaxID=3074381 RepID=A0AA86IYE5_9CAUD|nr:structural protein [Yersinia phage vB_Yru_GN1]
MSIVIKIMDDQRDHAADGDVSSRFSMFHVPDGGHFKINPPVTCNNSKLPHSESPDTPCANLPHEDYCSLTISDAKGSPVLSNYKINGNMYVLDNGKTISSFWGTKYTN